MYEQLLPVAVWVQVAYGEVRSRAQLRVDGSP